MTSIPAIVPPLPQAATLNRHLPPRDAFGWLARGWRDLMAQPATSLVYGLAVFAISIGIVYALFALGWDYVLFPALAGFMIVGPVLAVGLYEKSRRLTNGKTTSFSGMVFVKARSTGQILFIGVLLCLMMLVWMRAAVIIYALFFGLQPFPGLDHIVAMVFTTPIGWAMLIVGTLVGGLFAAFSFAISVLAIPMLLNERLDAFTAMGVSMALVWSNMSVMLTWGAIVLALFLVSLATGLLGLVIVFPLVGHATWHAYKGLRLQPE